jgi:hypothetical protein
MGRPRGALNKENSRARQLANELGVEPLKIVLLFAKGDAAALGLTEITADQRLDAAKSATKYLHARKTETDITSAGEPLVCNVFDYRATK